MLTEFPHFSRRFANCLLKFFDGANLHILQNVQFDASKISYKL